MNIKEFVERKNVRLYSREERKIELLEEPTANDVEFIKENKQDIVDYLIEQEDKEKREEQERKDKFNQEVEDLKNSKIQFKLKERQSTIVDEYTDYIATSESQRYVLENLDCNKIVEKLGKTSFYFNELNDFLKEKEEQDKKDKENASKLFEAKMRLARIEED